MDWKWYVAIVVAVFAGAIIYGLMQFKSERKATWQRLFDAFDGVTERRVMSIAPSGSADRLDYDGTPFLGAFELTNDVLRFYRFKVRNGSIIEFPVDRIRESRRIADHHEPAATLVIEAPDGRSFTINASVPERLCARLVRLGYAANSRPA